MSNDLNEQQAQMVALISSIARVAHQTNKAYCESIGDFSIVDWSEAPDWQIQSAIDGVGFTINNPDCTPEMSHKNWTAQKVRDGWVYGKEKNPELKMHPCMVPYNELPQEQQSKDYIFKAVVKTLAETFGLL